MHSARRAVHWANAPGHPPTAWRGIKSKKIQVIEISGVKIIPRSFAIEKGLITADDTVGTKPAQRADVLS